MPATVQSIERDELKKQIDKGDVIVVDALKSEEYDKFHLPGAINVPVGDNFDTRIELAVPDKDAKVVVYCYNTDCDASEKATSRMAELGYTNVYDYEEGKMDWKHAGLPIEN